jgi:hypothetical protein
MAETRTISVHYLDWPVSGRAAQHHFVNGGGGAYLTTGTGGRKHADGHVAGQSPVGGQDRSEQPVFEAALWWWTRDPRLASAPEGSPRPDYNVAPFFQTFIEVRVEPSAGRVRSPVRHKVPLGRPAKVPTLPLRGSREAPVEWVLC